MSWWETLHLVPWWKRRGISAIKTGQDAPSWMWCTWRLSFFLGALSFYVQSHFQPLPTKLVFGYFDRGSYNLVAMASILTLSLIPPLCLPGLWQNKSDKNFCTALDTQRQILCQFMLPPTECCIVNTPAHVNHKPRHVSHFLIHGMWNLSGCNEIDPHTGLKTTEKKKIWQACSMLFRGRDVWVHGSFTTSPELRSVRPPAPHAAFWCFLHLMDAGTNHSERS